MFSPACLASLPTGGPRPFGPLCVNVATLLSLVSHLIVVYKKCPASYAISVPSVPPSHLFVTSETAASYRMAGQKISLTLTREAQL